MSCEVYVDVMSVQNFIGKIKRSMEDMMHSSDYFFRKVNGATWDDRISETTLDIYRNITSILEDNLQKIDSLKEELSRKLLILDRYINEPI